MTDAPDNPRTRLDAALASVPQPVQEADAYPTSLGSLLRLAARHSEIETVVVGGVDLLETVRRESPALPGVPGALLAQVSLPRVATMVLDWQAFSSGPWMGALDAGDAALRSELVEAATRLRAAGGRVLALSSAPLRSPEENDLLTVCTADLANLTDPTPDGDTEHTPVWSAVHRIHLGRRGFLTPNETGNH